MAKTIPASNLLNSAIDRLRSDFFRQLQVALEDEAMLRDLNRNEWSFDIDAREWVPIEDDNEDPA